MSIQIAKNITRLKNAIQRKFPEEKLLYFTSQFYSDDQKRPVTKYTIKQAVYNPDKERCDNVVIFETYSQLQVLFFLRDYLAILNGEEPPHDNPQWEEAKKKYKEKLKKEACPSLFFE